MSAHHEITDPSLIEIVRRQRVANALEKAAIVVAIVAVGISAAGLVVWSLWWTLLHTVLGVI